MNDIEKIKVLVKNYQEAIHTQNEDDFRNLWTNDHDTLISITNQFNGLDAIVKDFLIGGIQEKYSSIDLIAENIEVHLLDQHTAIVIFAYHTECIRRKTQEPHGIKGLETQVVRKIGNDWKINHIHYSK